MPVDDELLRRCQELGISVDNIYHPQTGRITGDSQREMQQLVLNVEAANRAKRMWWIALFSAIASALSAAAAWIAVAATIK